MHASLVPYFYHAFTREDEGGLMNVSHARVQGALTWCGEEARLWVLRIGVSLCLSPASSQSFG